MSNGEGSQSGDIEPQGGVNPQPSEPPGDVPVAEPPPNATPPIAPPPSAPPPSEPPPTGPLPSAPPLPANWPAARVQQRGSGRYPVDVGVDVPDRIARWRPLVQWILAIPLYIVLYVLRIVASICVFIGWFVALFTGQLPESLGNLIAGYYRLYWRTTTYASFLRAKSTRLSECRWVTGRPATTRPGSKCRGRPNCPGWPCSCASSWLSPS